MPLRSNSLGDCHATACFFVLDDPQLKHPDRSMNHRAVTIVAGLLGLFLTRPCAAQFEHFAWTVFSALNSAQDVTFDDDGRLWVATTGGVVGFRPGDSSIVLRTSDGLLSLDASAIDVDPGTGDLYVGGSNGTISIRRASGSWSYSTDIAALADRPSRRINDFAFTPEGVYVATSFGVGLYDPTDSVFRESYLRFDPWPSDNSVNGIAVFEGRLWLGTDRGLTSAPLDSVTLASPASWTPNIGLNGDTITSLTVFDGRLVVATHRGVYDVAAGITVPRDDLPVGLAHVRASHTQCVAVLGGTIYTLKSGGVLFTELGSVSEAITAIAADDAGRVGVALPSSGYGVFSNGTFRTEIPNAPSSNRFTDLTLAADGSVWAASADRDVDGAGLSRLKDSNWARYARSNIPEMPTNKVWNVGTGANGTVWAGTFGGGAVEFSPVEGDRPAAVHYDASNSALRGLSGSGDFILVGKVIGDHRGRTWMTNWDEGGVTGPILVVKLAHGETGSTGNGWEAFTHPALRQRPYKWLVIDDFDTKWVGADQSLGSHPGLVYINDNGTPSDKSDDVSGVINSASGGLLSDRQTALAVDRDGELWIGTPNGISVLVNPGSVVASGARPVFRTIAAVRDQFIRAIAVDALNRKWIGTERGVIVLSFDGVDVLATYSTSNSPLVNDDVRSLLAVEATGDVYIGTVNGLSRVATDAVAGRRDGAQLRISPQPLRLPSSEGVRIDGLPENAIVKIMTVSGVIIREFPSPGGAIAQWDGRDAAGRAVQSGIYIIAAVSPQGDVGAIGKVAVIAR